MALGTLGGGAFARIKSRWLPSEFGLDTLIEEWQGVKASKAAFQATLTKWAASTVDSNMFLATWSDDDDPAKPTFELRYIGCKAGNINGRARIETTGTLQTLTYSQEIDNVGSVGLEVQYLAPTWTKNWIARSANVGDDVSDPTDNRLIVFWRYGALSSLSGIANYTTADVQSFISGNFGNLILPQPHSEELVPGQYYLNSKSKTLLWQR